MVIGVIAGGCATTQGAFSFLGERQPAKYADCHVDVFRGGVPQRPFLRVSRIDVHVERTFWRRPGLGDIASELRRQACLSGSDAIIEIKEEAKNQDYYVTATGVKYRSAPAEGASGSVF